MSRTAEAPVIGLVDLALGFYRSRTPGPATACIIDGVSCSQRFENAASRALALDKGPISAVQIATNRTIRDCMKLNGIGKPQAALVLATGIARNIIFGPALENTTVKASVNFVMGAAVSLSSLPFIACGCPNPQKAAEHAIGQGKFANNLGSGKKEVAEVTLRAAAGTIRHSDKYGGQKICP